ncbi:MAG: molybdopterin molybdotransferase MoeA [Saprospiraceae bacterium]
MISVEKATQIVLNTSRDFGDETVPLQRAAGRVLHEDLVADRDFPPFDRVAMDGIAISFDAFETGQRTFPVEGLQAAGAPQMRLQNPGGCLEVMTGAILPQQADTVIRYEDVEMIGAQATIAIGDVRPGQNVHRKGSDQQQGTVVTTAGVILSAAEIGVAATVGKAQLRVGRLPRAVIISTGDELVEVGETPLPHQIRKSNVHTLAAAVVAWQIEADLLHLQDEKAEVRSGLAQCLEEYDVLLMSGGVSAGKLDYVPGVLEELGVVKLFHKVAQRPGKPFWFGKAADGTLVFAFPGNPVSSFMCLYRYFFPWLRKSLGLPPVEPAVARLAEDFSFKPTLTYFLQVKLHGDENGQIWAVPKKGGGSGDLANLVEADAFLELPGERQHFSKGEVFPYFRYR